MELKDDSFHVIELESPWPHVFCYKILRCLALKNDQASVLYKLPLPYMITAFMPDLWLKKAIPGGSVMMRLQLGLPEFKQCKKHCWHDCCLANSRGLRRKQERQSSTFFRQAIADDLERICNAPHHKYSNISTYTSSLYNQLPLKRAAPCVQSEAILQVKAL